MKIYVLDTCVLIQDPEAIFKFEEHHVVIPEIVIRELDGLKESKGSKGAYARRALKNIKQQIIHVLSDSQAANFSLVEANPRFEGTNDDLIVATALSLQYKLGEEVVLVTNDLAMSLKATLGKLQCEEYRNEALTETLESNYKIVSDIDNQADFDQATEWGFKPVGMPPVKRDKVKCQGIYPRNIEQMAAMIGVMEADISILEGPAGSGKTLLAMACAMELKERGDYEAIVIMRNCQGMDTDIGFLPGTEEEKMEPWLEAFNDNLEIILECNSSDKVTMEQAKKLYNIKFRSTNFTRGRSYNNTIIIVDEVQNSTRHQLKTLITRVGQGSKIILLGNLAQIDTPYLDAHSSGLRHVCKKMLGYSGAHISIFKDVIRSPLAKYAEENL